MWENEFEDEIYGIGAFEMTRSKTKIRSKEKKQSKQVVYPKYVSHALIVKVRETTFQQELREAKDPNWELFWTLDKVEVIGNPKQAKRIYFRTGKGIRGYFKITGYGTGEYSGKNLPVVFFERKFYPEGV